MFSLHGFRPDAIDTAGRRRDVLLIDIGALYGDGPIRGLNTWRRAAPSRQDGVQATELAVHLFRLAGGVGIGRRVRVGEDAGGGEPGELGILGYNG